MAVCGRCLICGYKFNGKLDDDTEPDVAVRWTCSTCPPGWDEPREHKICTTCHDQLVHDEGISTVANALLALVRERAIKPEPEDKPT